MQFILKIALFELGSIFGLLASPPERIVGGTLGKPEKWSVSTEIYTKNRTFWTRFQFRDFGRVVGQQRQEPANSVRSMENTI